VGAGGVASVTRLSVLFRSRWQRDPRDISGARLTAHEPDTWSLRMQTGSRCQERYCGWQCHSACSVGQVQDLLIWLRSLLSNRFIGVVVFRLVRVTAHVLFEGLCIIQNCFCLCDDVWSNKYLIVYKTMQPWLAEMWGRVWVKYLNRPLLANIFVKLKVFHDEKCLLSTAQSLVAAGCNFRPNVLPTSNRADMFVYVSYNV